MVHRSAVFPQVWGIAAEVGEKQRNSNAGFSAFNLLLHSCWVAEIAPGLITACVGDLILFFFLQFLFCLAQMSSKCFWVGILQHLKLFYAFVFSDRLVFAHAALADVSVINIQILFTWAGRNSDLRLYICILIYIK